MPAVYAVPMRKRHRPAQAVVIAPPKAPRHYAADMLALPTKEARRAALAAVPESLREWVAAHVTAYFEKRRCLHRHYLSKPDSANDQPR